MNDLCPVCEIGTIAERIVPRVWTTATEHVVFDHKASLCDNCGWGGVTREQQAWNDQQLAAAKAAREA